MTNSRLPVSAISAEGICIRFGGVHALVEVSFSVRQGEVFSIIGPNGAGKTTLFNCISGLYQPSSGKILLHGEDVTDLPPYRLAARGLSRTFQNLQVFFRMSAIENVMVGRHMRERSSFLADLFALPAAWRQNCVSRDAALALLDRVGLLAVADKAAGSLSYGELKRLEIARALATEPKVLLLDEPAAGCNAVETEEIETMIRTIAASGTTVVLVEHDMRLVMRLSDKVLVLSQGRILSEGKPAEVRADPRVITAYLGQQDGADRNKDASYA